MQVALWSAAPRLGDVEANVRRVADALQEGGLVVFPELYLTGYNIGDDVQRLALQDDDARVAPLRDACRDHGAHLIVGAPRRVRPGIVRNSALCIDDSGSPTWIDKAVLPTFTTFREALFFQPGGPQEVWRTRLGGIGIHICYDLYFPELQRRQALDGADVLVNISASPATTRRFFEALLPARAIENACFQLYSNNVGTQDGLVFWGGAQAHGPRGQTLGRMAPYRTGCLRTPLDLDDLHTARQARPTLRDAAALWHNGTPTGPAEA